MGFRHGFTSYQPCPSHFLNSELGGISPAELKFGTSDYSRFKMPLPLVPGHHYGDLVRLLDNNLATVRSVTASYQQALRESRQNTTKHCNMYQPGDLVLWNPREHTHSFRTTKLAPKLLGPYVVESQDRNEIHCVHQHLNTSHVFHASRISPYVGTSSDAKHIGLLDSDESIIEKIIAHKGTWKSLPAMQFLVHWQGYDDTADSWEPWKSLRHAAALHAYLRSNKLDKYIPTMYRFPSSSP